ncbi:LacI family transcriptional regulator [Sphingomonas jejuensis]|uniref:LacI family transcriptional regulator n=1 Tax=Sphingomonas jejuensis TaxID=904715 RepID=A0ABX0XK19_9SPHN|nr:LacI family DNA-binding transcriptional regulator [Sphingomonas jejuensis]NJC33688.1 LacI family transcriptional regulator [Sphingomonas jejuensis]
MAGATIRDVAREAAASVASVSRVLNGSAQVRDSLRVRVENAIATLGYVPHAGARSLSLAQSNAIGVVLPDLHGEFFSELLRGMDQEASARGRQLLLSNIHDDPARAVAALQSMRGRVDGMVLMAPHLDPDALMNGLPSAVPAVMVNCAPHRRPAAELRVDSVAGAVAAVEHLVASGRRRIVHVAGPDSNVDARDRRRGYEQAMAAAGLSPMILEGSFNEADGVRAAEALIARPGMADALFAANDMMAIGAMTTLREAGIGVPDDVAVVGFDDIPMARLISPGLSTVRVDIAALGARAVARLVRQIDGIVDHDIELHPPVLIVRGSSQSNTSTTNPQGGSHGGTCS